MMNRLRGCQRCARLADYRASLQIRYPDYYNQPVPPFAAADPRLLIVGLAPGLHGANASGRPFTGDASGDLLFRSLHSCGFASQPASRAAADGMRLEACQITNAVKCVPPANRPEAAEIKACNEFLADEIAAMPAGSVVLALGTLAHRAVVRALGLAQSSLKFRHAAEYSLARNLVLLDSIHPSRYNQNTGRITPAMFDRVVARCKALLP